MNVKSVLPDRRLLRLSEILKVIPVSRSTWYKGVAEGRFPRPVSLGPRSKAYRVEDILALVQHGVVDPCEGAPARRSRREPERS
jgi:prophage regulatory protein